MEIGGISSSTAPFDSIVDQIILSIKESSRHIFIHLNMHNFYILKKNPELLDKFQRNCRVFFEGIGMKLAFFITNRSWYNDTNGTDLYPILFENLSLNKNKVYLLGAKETVLNDAVRNIRENYKGIDIIGYHHGFIGIENYKAVSEVISKAPPDLLIIGMGMEKEAEFIVKNYDRLSFGAIWCVGGLFDFISGNRKRAPKVMRIIRLEWLYRFLLEPKAKFKRIFVTPVWFFKCVLNEKFLNKSNYNF